ncbi:MAG: DNA replication and repair protein RecF [bacterium]|nr:DNA replication and repair protein RecF [bacterium]
MQASDFRLHESIEFRPAEGLTVVRGPNGAGKTSLLEAVGYLASLSSFRGAAAADLVRAGAPAAIIRGEFSTGGRRLLVEASVPVAGRARVQVNRQPLHRAADLCEKLPVLVFQPDDLMIVKGPPAARRDAVDDAVVTLRPRVGEQRRRLTTCLRQRNALLRQAGAAKADDATRRSLDVWDDRLGEAADAWAGHRRWVIGELQPRMERFFGRLTGAAAAPVEMSYEPRWLERGLAAALAESREEDLRRGVTTVGPHRDDIEWRVGPLAARTHASQGNQRSLALAYRLALHEALSAAGEPLLLLDDVFSELDAARTERLLELLPAGQTVLATAGDIPPAARPALVVSVSELPAAGT